MATNVHEPVLNWKTLLERFDIETSAQDVMEDYVQTNMPAPEPYTSMTIPVIRRHFPRLLAEELVSTQPMTSDSGLLFHLRYRPTPLKPKPVVCLLPDDLFVITEEDV